MARSKKQSVRGANRSRMAAAFLQIKSETPPPVDAPPVTDVTLLRQIRKEAQPRKRWNFMPMDIVSFKRGSETTLGTIITAAPERLTLLVPGGVMTIHPGSVRLVDRSDSCEA